MLFINKVPFLVSVSHKSERQVIITLLELARLGYKYGLEPPNIIKIEKEIEQEQIEEDTPPEPPQKPKPPTSARSRPLNLDEEVRGLCVREAVGEGAVCDGGCV